MDAKDKIIAELQQIIEAQKLVIAELTERIRVLEKKLNIDSSNSGMPPSSDKFTQKFKNKNKQTSLREKSQNTSGGVLGHKGETLEMVSTPDDVIVSNVANCPACGSVDLEDTQIMEVSQTLEIEPAKKRIIETRHRRKVCKSCGHNICLAGRNTLRYGEGAKAFAVYLNCNQLLPYNRTQEAIHDICNVCPSEGSIANWVKEQAFKLKAKTQEIELSLLKSKIKHVDESGCGLKKQWLHVLSNGMFTLYEVAKRGGASWMPKLNKKHMLVASDCFGAYLNKKFKNILCNQHIMRECKNLEEVWSSRLYTLLRYISHTKNTYAKDNKNIPKHLREKINRCYDKILAKGMAYHLSLAPLKRRRRAGHNLLRRLIKHKIGFLRCIYDKDIPFTNNQAERDIRMIKTKVKTGAFRTENGCKLFCITHGINILAALQNPQLLHI